MDIKKAKTWGEVTKIFTSIYNQTRNAKGIKKKDSRRSNFKN